MLGRVRPSSFTLECLELERAPSKSVKDDSLSVYEATILKLRQGSKRDLASTSDHVTDETNDDSSIPANMLSSSITSMEIVTSDISTSCLTNSNSGISNENNKKTSIAYMFARYNKSCQQSRSVVVVEDLMMVESSCSSGSSCSSPDDTLAFDSCPQPEKK
ncbi:uncharacterized protein LOC124918410 [Impatiens glandulifera]|uniref:uncharacterized protein LOC124918410 n=1 Tax=Impatiens glandulifera TaxID=253017 RepID=UPI001FB194B0|nr:uncharacterized protein LOC124918410 [Impatiens glandulifera]